MAKDIIIIVINAYLVCMMVFTMLYILRHYFVSLNRLFGRQRLSHHDIIDDDFFYVTIIVPMHNEEKVIDGVLNSLRRCDYPHDRMEIIGLNDHSTDRTAEILDGYVEKSRRDPNGWPVITAFHRYQGPRGKQNALNDALEVAKGEIILVFDADYLPPRDIIRSLAANFKDPEVGAVMGRVIPINTKTNLLMRLEDLERTGGYQIDQQAKYNSGFIPLYGGTVGGFRKSAILDLGGFVGNILAEDTELTFRLIVNGWEIVYDNRAECYEESPESWEARAKQIRRWSRGHNQILLTRLLPFLFSSKLSFRQKFDGTLVLFIYLLPLLWWISWFLLFVIWFIDDIGFAQWLVPVAITLVHGSVGNFAPFFQIGIGSLLDGSSRRVLLLPYFLYYFSFSLWFTSLGALQAFVDVVTRRAVTWQKTERIRAT
ncbi:MAG: glycosyltransferase family 2 protein [Tannerella sp.]|jgi:cellulose synthase/poly-beta-1,6-N-acetylglucosamine synthase-like glycosyltransferase|nr:glycosyltransferase family 2 protein [Tannerella sp.]